MTRKAIVLLVLAVAFAGFAAAAWYVDRQSAAPVPSALETAQSEALVRSYSPILGPEQAPVTIVEFFDPACEACRAFYPVVESILARYPDDVRVVLRYAPFHGATSEEAVKVLEAARMQGVFVPVLETLLEAQPLWAAHGSDQQADILQIARTAGLDMEAASTQVMSPSTVGLLNQDRADIETLGISQTPTFFVNGRPLTEFGVQELQALVDEEVERSGGG